MSDSVRTVRELFQSLMSRNRREREYSYSSDTASGSGSGSGSSWESDSFWSSSPRSSPAQTRRNRAQRFKNPRSLTVATTTFEGAGRKALRQDSGFVDADDVHHHEQEQDEEVIDYLSTIPTELMLRILKFLGAYELCHNVNRLNKYLHVLSNDEYIWRAICNEKWSTKKHIKLQLHPRADFYSVLPSLDILSDDEIRQILSARHVPSDEFDENTRRRSLERLLRETVPEGAEDVGCSGGKWKTSYMAAELDSTRTELTEQELLEISWSYSASSSWYDDENKSVTVKFWKTVMPDGRVRRTRGPVDGGGWPQMRLWEMDPHDGMQVLHMPQHSTTRKRDWGWKISNGYVVYDSQ